MKHAFRLLPTFTLRATARLSLPAAAGPYASLVVFGDSLSDSGNNAALGLINPGQVIPATPTSPAAPTRHGPTATDLCGRRTSLRRLARHSPTLAAGRHQLRVWRCGHRNAGPGPWGFPFSLLVKANQYLGPTGNVASPNALYVIEGGGNDARAALAAIAGGALLGPTIASTAASFAAKIGTMSTNSNWPGPSTLLSGTRPMSVSRPR